MLDWSPCEPPCLRLMRGRFVIVAPAEFPADKDALFEAIGGPNNDDLWQYIPFGPFDSPEALGVGMQFVATSRDWRTHILRQPDTMLPAGMASYMRLRPEHGSAEIGCIVFSKSLQRTPAATEAMYLMARHVFDDLGYRRYEWKCHRENAASRRAAKRLGFTFEGTFRNDMVVKGASRDTNWYSMTDDEWPAIRAAFEAWLSPENFDNKGMQKRSLAALRKGS